MIAEVERVLDFVADIGRFVVAHKAAESMFDEVLATAVSLLLLTAAPLRWPS